MTVKDQADQKDQDQDKTPLAEAEEEDFKTPEDLAYEEAERELAEAERAAQEGQDQKAGAEDDAEAKEFEDVDKVDDENADKAAQGEQKSDDADKDSSQDETKDKDKEVVPLAALLQERREYNNRVRELELELARRDGALSATQGKSDGEGDGQASRAEKSPDEQIADLNTQIDNIWEQADEGDLTLKEARKQERELQERIQALKSANEQPGQDVRQVVLDARIEENLVELEQKYPVIKALNEEQMTEFVQRAYQQAEEEGQPIGTGALETMRLHNMAASAAHEHFAQFYQQPNPQPADAAQGQGQGSSQQQSPNGQPSSGENGLSKQAQDRAAKLDLQAKHPPDINQIGSAAEGTLTDQQVLSKLEGMDEEEQIEFLETIPPSLAQRLGVG